MTDLTPYTSSLAIPDLDTVRKPTAWTKSTFLGSVAKWLSTMVVILPDSMIDS